MLNNIIEVNGKRYSVVRSTSKVNPCVGCAFLKGTIDCISPFSPKYAPCLEFDNFEAEIYHILKEL